MIFECCMTQAGFLVVLPSSGTSPPPPQHRREIWFVAMIWIVTGRQMAFTCQAPLNILESLNCHYVLTPGGFMEVLLVITVHIHANKYRGHHVKMSVCVCVCVWGGSLSTLLALARSTSACFLAHSLIYLPHRHPFNPLHSHAQTHTHTGCKSSEQGTQGPLWTQQVGSFPVNISPQMHSS